MKRYAEIYQGIFKVIYEDCSDSDITDIESTNLKKLISIIENFENTHNYYKTYKALQENNNYFAKYSCSDILTLLSYSQNPKIFFISLCEKGFLEYAKYIRNTFKLEVSCENNSALRKALNNGQIRVVDWLLSEGLRVRSDDISLISSSKKGDITTLNYIYNTFKHLISYNTVIEAFNQSIIYDKICSTEFIVSNFILTNIEINQGIQYCCSFGRLNILQFLLSNFRVIHNLPYYAKTAVAHDNLDILQYFETLPEFSNVSVDILFFECCLHNKLDIAQYLYEKYKIDIHDDDDYAFECVCSYGYVEFAKWLYSLGGVNIEDEKIKDYFIKIIN